MLATVDVDLKKDINALEHVQPRAIKTITSLRKLPYMRDYELRLKECKLTTFGREAKEGQPAGNAHTIMHGLERVP